MIADFCAIGGQITKRVFPPLNTTDYAPFVRQLPRPGTVDGYMWVVGGTGTAASLKAFEQAYGKIDPKQHAGNPVDWFAWGDEAFAKARAENKPIFLSIGYSTCHWCHVMEHESF